MYITFCCLHLTAYRELSLEAKSHILLAAYTQSRAKKLRLSWHYICMLTTLWTGSKCRCVTLLLLLWNRESFQNNETSQSFKCATKCLASALFIVPSIGVATDVSWPNLQRCRFQIFIVCVVHLYLCHWYAVIWNS